MQSVAAKLKLQYATRAYETKKKPAPSSLQEFFPEGMPMMTDAFRKELDGLKPGEISRTILEDESGFRIVRLQSHSQGTYQTEEISLAKKSFGPWFAAQVKHVRLQVPDVSLRQQIQALDPSLHVGEEG